MITGYLTNMLSKKYQEQGFTLTEDEDFLYLRHPTFLTPKVFIGVNTSIFDIEYWIDNSIDK
jgi:hypothetical protein